MTAPRELPQGSTSEDGDARDDDLALVTQTVLASRALLGIVARSVAPALEQVSLPQFRALVLLSAAGPSRTRDLADRLGVHPSTLSRTADRLVLGGWVHRADNPDNRREVMLTLTPKARRLVEGVTSRRAREIEQVLATLPARQRRAALTGFTVFAAAAGETDEGDLLLLGIAPDQPAPA